MTHNEKQGRQSTRLANYDYTAPGGYFVTVCAHGHECLFGHLLGVQMRLNTLGKVVRREWLRSAEIRPEVQLDAFVVMPNHLHGIVIVRDVGAHGRAPLPKEPRPDARRRPHSLGSLLAGFKSAVTKQINEIRGTPRAPVWQRNYHDRVIRNQGELDARRQYIADNPAQWEMDPDNPATW